MQNKIRKYFFWSILGLSTFAVVGSLGSMALNLQSKNNNLTPLQGKTSSKLARASANSRYYDETSTGAFNVLKDPVDDLKKCIWTTNQGMPYANVDEGVYSIDWIGIRSNVFEIVTLPQSLQVIRAHSIEECGNLLTITIPSRVANIGSERSGYRQPVFHDDPKLTKIILLCQGTRIENNAFGQLPSNLKCYIVDHNMRRDIINNGLDGSRIFDASVVEDDFVVANVNGERTLVGLTHVGRTKNNLNVPFSLQNKVDVIDDYAFTEQKINRSDSLKIKLNNPNIRVKENSFWGLPQSVTYEVANKDVAKRLINICHINADRITFPDESGDFLISNSKIIGLTESGKTKAKLTISRNVTAIDSSAFSGTSSGLTEIRFEKGSQLSSIGSAFNKFKNTDTKFYFDKNDISTARILKKNEIVDDQIILTIEESSESGSVHRVFNVTIGGTLVHAETNGTEIVINNTIAGIEINSIAESAFKGSQLKDITFATGSKIVKVNEDAFKSLNKSSLTCHVNLKDVSLITALRKILKSEQVVTQSGVEFNLSDTKITKVKRGAVKDGSIFIPKTYEGSEVSGISGDNTFEIFNNTTVEKIVFDREIGGFEITNEVLKQLASHEKLRYYVDASNKDTLVPILKNGRIAQSQIIVTSENFDITSDGSITSVKQIPPNGTLEIGSKINGVSVTKISAQAFNESKGINKVVFAKSLEGVGFSIDKGALNKLDGNKTYYYVQENDANIIKVLRDAQVSPDHVIFSGNGSDKFEIDIQHRIHEVKMDALDGHNINIPTTYKNSTITGINAHAFKNFETSGKLSSITFEENFGKGGEITIPSEAFNELDLFNTKFYVKVAQANAENSPKVVEALKNSVSKDSQVIVRDSSSEPSFEITVGRQLIRLKPSDKQSKRLLIESTYGGIKVAGIGSKAFEGANFECIEFSSGIQLIANEMSAIAFGGLAKNPIIYMYGNSGSNTNTINALRKIDEKIKIGVNNGTGDFFIDAKNSARSNGLTSAACQSKTLTLPKNIKCIGDDTFNECSPELRYITIFSPDCEIEENAFNTDAFKKVKDKIMFTVYSKSVKELLLSKKFQIKADKIKLINLGGVSSTTIGLVTASILVAIILLGLGIGIPMRKQHKISLLQAKLNGKRIDKLSAANALAFKKVIEVTGSIRQEVRMLSTDMKALKAATPLIGAKALKATPAQAAKNANAKPITAKTSSKPAPDSEIKKESTKSTTPTDSAKSTAPANSINLARSTTPVNPIKSANPTAPANPINLARSTTPVNPTKSNNPTNLSRPTTPANSTGSVSAKQPVAQPKVETPGSSK